jgi:hypothetical protein
MLAAAATCPRCGLPLPETCINGESTGECVSCGAQVLLQLYPAVFKRLEAGKEGETILVAGEASCFYHPQKRAAVPCATCGRFLCSLCDIDFNGQHLCPVCLEGGQKKGRIVQFEKRRTLYDSLALHLCFFPIVINSPAAVVMAIYAWNKPTSIVRRTRVRVYVALILGLLETAGWVFGFIYG